MPVMDGIALALAAARDHPAMSILLMTGYADQRERASGLEALIHDVVTKPFSLVTIRAAVQLKEAKGGGLAAPGVVLDRHGRGWVLGNQGRVHMLMAGHSMLKIEKLYGSVFEGILGEKISTKPVEVVTPFPWLAKNAAD